MQVRIVPESEVDEALDSAIRESLCECWPSYCDVFSKTRAWHGSEPAWSVVLEEAGRVIAHASVVERTIRVGEQPLSVAGIMSVMVVPDHRGCRLSEKVMQTAIAEAGSRDYDFGLLFCVPEIEKVYARVGWRALPDAEIVRVDEAGRECSLPGRNIAMYYPLKERRFPEGRVHLQGNDW